MSISRVPVRPATLPTENSTPLSRRPFNMAIPQYSYCGVREETRFQPCLRSIPHSAPDASTVSTFAPFALGITGLGEVTRSGPVPYRFMMADPIGGNAGLDDFTTEEASPAGQGLAVGHFSCIFQANRAHQALAAWAGH